jgi:ABC-type polysaccharide transport system permease subunit
MLLDLMHNKNCNRGSFVTWSNTALISLPLSMVSRRILLVNRTSASEKSINECYNKKYFTTMTLISEFWKPIGYSDRVLCSTYGTEAKSYDNQSVDLDW